MQLHFIKVSHQNCQLICYIENDEVFNRTLEAKSLLRHDLMHYCVETVAGLKNSFFAILAKHNITDEAELMITERVVVILQKMDIDQNYTPANYFKILKNSFIYQQEPVPEFITYDLIEKIGIKYLDLLQKYNDLKTGNDNRIILEF
jgi:hypothetical protein